MVFLSDFLKCLLRKRGGFSCWVTFKKIYIIIFKESGQSTPVRISFIFVKAVGRQRRVESRGDTGEKMLVGLYPRPLGVHVAPEAGVPTTTPKHTAIMYYNLL